MESKNTNHAVQSKATFSVAKDVFYPNLKTDKSILDKMRDSNDRPTILNPSKSIACIHPMAIKEIEEKLKLTFLYEKDAESQVCMANNPEVRDDFKDIFDIKDLLNYSYAVLNSHNYLERYKDVSKIDFFQVPYPNSISHFWKLGNLGTKLRALNLLESSSAGKHNIEIDEILKKISEIKIK